MKLFATPLSHFSRKVRILLDCHGAPYELVDAGNVAEQDAAAFGGNPLMKVPVLVDGDVCLNDSDAIAGYVTDRLDPADRYRVRTTAPRALAARAVMNGAMAAEVEIILAERTGVPTREFAFFAKARRVIENSLAWLESRAGELCGETPGYAGFHVVCMWEHLAHYGTVPLAYPRLAEIARRVGDLEPVARSGPRRRAVGW